MSASTPRRPGALRDIVTGVGLLLRGFGTWRSAPGLMLAGLVPAVVVAVVFLAGFIALGLNLEAIVVAISPFAEGWDEPWRSGIRVLIGLAFVVAAVLLVVNTFTTITLMVGAPFYDRIWRHVEASRGEVPDDGPPGFWKGFSTDIADGLRMLAPTLLIGVGVFALGLVPAVGTALAAVLGALLGGSLLAIELTATAFNARGRTLRERRAALRSRRALTLGYGVGAYLLFLLPLGAIIAMPAAVAGSALLARRIEDDAALTP